MPPYELQHVICRMTRNDSDRSWFGKQAPPYFHVLVYDELFRFDEYKLIKSYACRSFHSQFVCVTINSIVAYAHAINAYIIFKIIRAVKTIELLRGIHES